MNRKIFLALNLLISPVIPVWAEVLQTEVTGNVEDKAGEPLPGCTVLFLQSDTIAGYTTTDNKGKFEIKGMPKGEYKCNVSCIGYEQASELFTLSGKVKLSKFILEPSATLLDEITVSAGMRSKELAGMTVFYLSDRAKNQSNAYDALMEIPRLLINPSTKTIQFDDQRTPLILINGVRKPLDAIDPKIIESVEVIDNPSARYRGDEKVSAVLNVKIKKDGIKPYIRGNFGLMYSFGDNGLWAEATLESGTATSSLYAKGVFDEWPDTRNDIYSDITQGILHHVENEKNKIYYYKLPVYLGGDKEFSKKDYLAYRFDYVSSKHISHSAGDGTVTDMNSGRESPLTSIYYGKTPFQSFGGNIYYKHSFTKNRLLEFDGRYDYAANSSIGRREANSELYNYISEIDLYNKRNSGRLEANYSDLFAETLHFEAGSNTEYSVTKFDDKLDPFPLFAYKRTLEYLYAGIDNNSSKSKINYVVSLGLDLVFTDVEGVKHNYVDFVPSVSLSYKITGHHNLKFQYTRSRTLPSITSLNPYNTSTDSLKIVIGNPLLEPYHNNNFRIEYNANIGKVRLTPYFQYIYQTDLIQPLGYMENNIYVSSYDNYGHKEVLQAGLNFNLRLPCGYLSLFPYYYKAYLKDMPYSGENFVLAFQGYLYYKKVSMNWYFNFIPAYSYSLYTKATSLTPNSRIHLQWNPSRSLSFVFQMQNFLFPRFHSKTWTNNRDYLAFTSSVSTNLHPMIQIGVWYNFVSKNFKNRNKKSFKDGSIELENMKAN